MNNEQEKKTVFRAIKHLAKSMELMRSVDQNSIPWGPFFTMLDTLDKMATIIYGHETPPGKNTKKKQAKKKKPTTKRKAKRRVEKKTK